MAFVEINCANIYYQVHGQAHLGWVPILLINNLMRIDELDWTKIAPRLPVGTA